jgi:flagellar biosynthesis/type III secretory pathway protein FliH
LYSGKIIKAKNTAPYYMPYFESVAVEEKEEITLNQEYEQPEMTMQMIESIEREAYEKGFAVGEKAGLDMGERKASILLDKLESIVMDITSMKEKILKDLEPQIFDLTVAIAKRIVVEELSMNPDRIAAIVKEAMRRIQRTGTITIKLNPTAHAILLKVKPELIDIHPDIVFDVDTSASAPVVIGPVQEVITDIDAQIKNIIEDIRKDIDIH